MQSYKVKHRSPTPDSSTSGDTSEIRTPSQRKAHANSTPIRHSKVSASAVNRKVWKHLSEGFNKSQAAAMVSAPPPIRDSVSTFIQHLETDIREKVKPKLHDDLLHEITTTVLTYKKKESTYINVALIPNYNPSYPVQSFQMLPNQQNGLITTIESIQATQPPPIQQQAVQQQQIPPQQQRMEVEQQPIEPEQQPIPLEQQIQQFMKPALDLNDNENDSIDLESQIIQQ